MNTKPPYRIFPLGDTALTIDFGNSINVDINNEVFNRFRQLKDHPLPGIIEMLPAYCSLTLLYDLVKLRKKTPSGVTVFDWIKGKVEERLQQPVPESLGKTKLIRVPVCYNEEFAPDMQQVTSINNITREEVIQIHTSIPYRVYMLGFLPGFAYMGEVDERIAVQRKTEPQWVAAGSVGIAGRQTGIYPLASPGGWQIIGRTPLKLFDAGREEPVLIEAGDMVEFYAVSINEFTNH